MDSGCFEILDKKIIVKDDPMATLFGKQGRIEEWIVRRPNNKVVRTRIIFWYDK